MLKLYKPLALASVVALAACTSTPAPETAVATTPTVTPAQRLATIEQVAGVADNELNVQPLRDPEVDDLRQQAQHQQQAGDLDAAIGSLDQALQLVSGDPGLLQERAELALLKQDYQGAEKFALQALQLGSRTGPLCRRHWATVEQSRLARDEQQNAESAHAQIDTCTVAGIQRF